MNSSGKWDRRPSSEWPDERREDLFHCHSCNRWFPWFKFVNGHYTIFSSGRDVYEIMNGDDLGGHRWACDLCIYRVLRMEKLITITDTHGNLVRYEDTTD